MKSQPIKNDITGPIVKISWSQHNRQYDLGIKQFLEEMGINATDEEILIAVRKILNKS